MLKRKTLGIGFLDELSKVTPSSGHFKKTKETDWRDSLLPNFDPHQRVFIQSRWRVIGFCGLSILLFFLIFLRLFHLQIVKGEENLKLADGNRIQIRTIHAPRGVIFDRNGKILAQNSPGFRLTLKNPSGETKFKYISRDEALEMETKNDPQLANLEIDSIRIYPMGEVTVHILGYVGEISKKELEDSKYQKKYHQGDKIGRGGVEETYEEFLRGTDGGEVIEVDAEGKKIRTLRKTESIPGQNLYLSIDSQLQTFVFDQLRLQTKKVGSCCAAAVLQDPNSGQILSLVSLPSYDPKDLTAALNSPNSPILNRTIAGMYPPGSTFKIATSLAGLASGKVTPSTIFDDTGVVYLGPFKFTNWYFTQYGKVEGPVDMVKAIKRSNDTYYYRLSLVTGEKIIGETAGKMSLGKKTGIDISGEEMGLIPTDEWKRQNLDEVWFPGDTLHLSIGQGFLLTTPLQVSNLINIIAAGGKYLTPHLAHHLTDPFGSQVKEFKFWISEPLFKKDDIEIIKRGLGEVPKSGGTAWPFFTFPIPTAGKTGTAEYGDSKNRTHAWYTSYGPIDDPRISVTILIEGGGEGSSVAAPVAKEIYRWYLSENKKDLIKDLGQVATDSARTLGE